jgi:hypothetical protein
MCGTVPPFDLLHCFVALGCKFQCHFGFSANKNWELISAPGAIQSYLRDLAAHLQALTEVAKISVKEQLVWNCKFINAH